MNEAKPFLFYLNQNDKKRILFIIMYCHFLNFNHELTSVYIDQLLSEKHNYQINRKIIKVTCER